MARVKNTVEGFWDRVDEEIHSQNKTKLEVARHCGFDRKILSERRNLSMFFLFLLCKELDVSADWLLFGNDWEMEE